jgi:glycosyltransferase involved in cell wall biosynthesis
MHSNIPTGRKLLVVSDTAMGSINNTLLGFEPVVRELDSISDLFDEIIWLGYFHDHVKSAIAKPMSPFIKMIAMPASGGGGIFGAIKILLYYPIYLFYILKYRIGVTHVHTRAPSHPSLLAMYLSTFDTKRIYWHKYAGNWNEINPPKSYAFQRSLLKTITRKNVYATINGKWPGQNENTITFENPCLTKLELVTAKSIGISKEFNQQLTLLFVGNLSAFKGIKQLVDALELIDQPQRFSELIIAGDGDLRQELEGIAMKERKVPIKILGAVKREELVKIYSKAHVNILPSASEGFPKVIAEGAAYGCIPLVTDVSSIGQYVIDGQNGYLLQNNNVDSIKEKLNQIVCSQDLKSISLSSMEISNPFTYEYFNTRISNMFINQ